MRRHIAIIVIVLSLAAVSYIQAASLQSYAELDKRGPSARNAKECESLGGKWQPAGILGTMMCDVPTKDAGKPCKDITECESTCITSAPVSYGQVITGQCLGSFLTFGCLTRVHNGKAGATVCAD